jgi:hypothetical protein
LACSVPIRCNSSDDLDAGFALTARAGYSFIDSEAHFLGLTLEAFPTFYGDVQAYGFALNLQWQLY